MREVLVATLVLACPVMMIWMMRGHGHGHGHGAGDHGQGHHNGYSAASIDELRRQRDELDRAIAERERSERDEQHEHDPTITQAITPEAANERRQARVE